MLELLLAIVLTSTYFFTVGVSYRKLRHNLLLHCAKCSKGRSCYSDHGVTAGFFSIFWPLGLPLMLGRFGPSQLLYPDRPPRTNRVTARRQNEIAEARHQKELARIRAEETALLERALEK